jgi:hypothetical protein
MRDRLLYLSLAAAVLVAAMLIGKVVYDYRVFRALHDEGRITTATIDGVELAVHNRLGPTGPKVIRYSFETAAKEPVTGIVGVPREKAGQFRVGQRIDVVYVPADPSITALDSGQAWDVVLYDERVLVPYMAFLMVLGWNALERFRRRRA